MRVENKYCTVKHVSGDIHVSNYFESARVETQQTVNTYDDVSNIPASDVLPMPEEGERVEENKVYSFEGKNYHVVQPHVRTHYHPDETPALFAVTREDTGSLEWIENEKVNVGDVRIYEGIEYEVIQAHMTQADWTPDSTPTLWGKVSTSSEWETGVAYSVGDTVTYNGNQYECLQAHTSQAGWNPEAAPALWSRL